MRLRVRQVPGAGGQFLLQFVAFGGHVPRVFGRARRFQGFDFNAVGGDLFFGVGQRILELSQLHLGRLGLLGGVRLQLGPFLL